MRLKRFAAAISSLAIAVLVVVVGLSSPNQARGLILPTLPPQGVAIVVDTTSDLVDPGGGKCSLRAAIGATNINGHAGNCDASLSQPGGTDGILFNIGTGTPVINIGSTPLPPITDKLAINGNSGGADRVEIRGPDGPIISGHDGLTIDPTAPGSIIEHLVIDNSADDGILIEATNVALLGNFIGADATGTSASPNQGYGVHVTGNGVRIGGATDGGPCSGDCNLISGNFGGGISLDNGESGAVIKGNFIGPDITGTKRFELLTFGPTSGIYTDGGNDTIGGANGTTPGGACTGDCNLIGGNGNGVYIDAGGTGTLIQGNFIGADITGSAAVGNHYGVYDVGGDVAVGGGDPRARNVISGNGGPGILMSGQGIGAPGATVQGNYIGVNAAGTGALANTGAGVLIQTTTVGFGAHDNVVRGNVVSGNKGMGIHITGAETAHNTIRDNLIGTDAGGTQPLGNTTPGIGIDGGVPSALIVGNTISANYIGVDITQTTTSDIELFTNYIGTNAGLDAGLGNKDVGIHIGAASGITIGGLTAPAAAVEANGPGGAAPGGNVIRNNTFDAIILEGANAVHDRISGNSIDDNGGVGISNQGSNNEQAAPVMNSAQNGNGVTHIVGTLTSTPNQTFAVEVFVSPACDPSGFGEGRGFEAGVAVNTDSAGLGKIDMGFGPPVAAGSVITATATDSAGDTSDFSNCATVVGATPTPSPTPTPTPHATPTPTATPSGLNGDANCDGKVDPADALAILGDADGVTPHAPCQNAEDVDCNGHVEGLDALRVLRWFIGAAMAHGAGCPEVGAPLT